MALFEHICTVIILLGVVTPNCVTVSSGATDIEEITDTAFHHTDKTNGLSLDNTAFHHIGNTIGLSLDNTPTFSLLTQWIDRRGLHRKRVCRHKPEPAVSNCVLLL